MASFVHDNSTLFKKEQAIIAKLFIKSPHVFHLITQATDTQ